jgi:hypothetical protein
MIRFAPHSPEISGICGHEAGGLDRDAVAESGESSAAAGGTLGEGMELRLGSGDFGRQLTRFINGLLD